MVIKSLRSYRRERRKWYPNPIPSSCPECGAKCQVVTFDNCIRLDCPSGHEHTIWESKEAERLGVYALRSGTDTFPKRVYR
jgi:hypothetical protein